MWKNSNLRNGVEKASRASYAILLVVSNRFDSPVASFDLSQANRSEGEYHEIGADGAPRQEETCARRVTYAVPFTVLMPKAHFNARRHRSSTPGCLNATPIRYMYGESNIATRLDPLNPAWVVPADRIRSIRPPKCPGALITIVVHYSGQITGVPADALFLPVSSVSCRDNQHFRVGATIVRQPPRPYEGSFKIKPSNDSG